MTDNSKALAIVPRTLEETSDLAERFSKSTLLPKSMQGKAADVLVTIMAGAEMGLSPMASLRAIHVIEGRPVLSADAMIALVLGSGKAVYFDRVEENADSVTYETLRVGSKTPRRCTWTMAMAKAAALDKKDNWRLYQRPMLASRAKAELARDVYPDVLLGVYLEDELERAPIERAPAVRAAPAQADDVIDVEQVTEPAELSAITSASSVEALKGLAETLSAVPEEWKAIARDRYASRMKELRAA